jgi:hypothetical protein
VKQFLQMRSYGGGLAVLLLLLMLLPLRLKGAASLPLLPVPLVPAAAALHLSTAGSTGHCRAHGLPLPLLPRCNPGAAAAVAAAGLLPPDDVFSLFRR